jgi:hypothetical protein
MDAGSSRTGRSSPPESASGKVVGGTGGSGNTASSQAGSGAKSSYSIKGGRMDWVDETGTETFIAITAGKFDPALRATVSLNGVTWSSAQADGAWNRRGKVWEFKTQEGGGGPEC